MARIAVVCVHGMGNQPANFADEMVKELRDRLKGRGVDPDLFAFSSAWWGEVMEGAENKLYTDLSRDADMDWEHLRKDIVISGFGDALAYVGPPNSDSEVYEDIHDVLGKALEEMKSDLEDPEVAPLIVFAHSLGCAISSNYVWDAQHGSYSKYARNSLARCKTLLGLVTYGCNLPLFTLAHAKSEIQPISLPGRGPSKELRQCFPNASDQEIKDAAQWLNFYDPDDILGYPLRGINLAYKKTVTADVSIDTGTILGAHTDYWTDDDFTKPVAKYLASIGKLITKSGG